MRYLSLDIETTGLDANTCHGLCRKICAILDGEDEGHGVASEPWEGVRRRLLALVNTETIQAPYPESYDPDPAKCQYCGDYCNHNNKQIKLWRITKECSVCPDCVRKRYNPDCQGW